MTQTRDLIKKMADFFKGEEFYEKGEDARLELSPDDVRCMNYLIHQRYKTLEQEPCEDWHDIPSSEMTIEQARQAVRELRKYVMDNHILSKSGDAINRQAVLDEISDYNNDLDYTTNELYDRIKRMSPVNPQPKYEDIAKAFQFGLAFGFGKKHDEMDKVIDEIKKVITPHPKTGCEGCKYEKTGNNSTYPCNHCGRCYTDKYNAESEDKE